MPQQKMNNKSLYKQIADYIQRQIDNGEWGGGSKIPSETQIAAQFKVSRETVRHAIAELQTKGLLSSKRGAGTFVTKPAYKWDYLKMFFPTEAGTYHSLLEIKIIQASESLSQILAVPLESEVYEISRLRYLADERSIPTIFEKSYFSKSLNVQMELIDFNKRLYDFLESNEGIKLTRFKNLIEPTLPTAAEARYLKCNQNKPILLLSRIGYSGDRPIILTKSIVNSDRLKLEIEL